MHLRYPQVCDTRLEPAACLMFQVVIVLRFFSGLYFVALGLVSEYIVSGHIRSSRLTSVFHFRFQTSFLYCRIFCDFLPHLGLGHSRYTLESSCKLRSLVMSLSGFQYSEIEIKHHSMVNWCFWNSLQMWHGFCYAAHVRHIARYEGPRRCHQLLV